MKSFVFCLAFMLMQGQIIKAQSTTERTGTDLCTADELDELVRDHDACYTEAAQSLQRTQYRNIFEGLFGGEKKTTGGNSLFKSRCRYVGLKLACDEEFAPRCLSAVSTERFKLKTINKERETAMNSSDILGEDYIRSCDVLREYESTWLINTFGSTKCSFNQGKRVISERDTCEAKVIAYRKILTTTPGLTADDLKQIFCAYNSALLKCNDDIRDCTAGVIRAQFDKDQRKSSQGIEQSIRDIGGVYADFSFDLDCSEVRRESNSRPQKLSGGPQFRRRRSASPEPLSAEMIAAAEHIASPHHQEEFLYEI